MDAGYEMNCNGVTEDDGHCNVWASLEVSA